MAKEPINGLRELLMGDPEASTQAGRDGYLKTNGISVEQFARKIGVTRTSVYYYVRDRSRPTLSTLEKICKEVGISLAEGFTYCTPREEGRQPLD